MSRRRGAALIGALCAAVLLIAAPGPAFAGEGTSPTGEAVFPVIGQEENLGAPIQTVSLNDSAIGEHDGKSVAYTTASGENAVFNVIDVTSQKLVAAHPMPGVVQAWRHVIAPDGTVFIGVFTGAGTGELWSYDPVRDELHKRAIMPGGVKSVWALTLDDAGRVYVGNYPTGNVVRFDPATDELRDYGRIVEGQEYVRSLAFADGTVFVGTGSRGNVVALDPESGVARVISDDLPAILGVTPEQMPFAYSMGVADRTLVVQFYDPLMRLAFYDLDTGVWRETTIGKNVAGDVGAFNFGQLPVRDGHIYVPVNRRLIEVDLADLSVRDVAAFGTSLRGAGWVHVDDPRQPVSALATIQSGGQVTLFDVDTGAVVAYPTVMSGQPGPLHTLEFAGDGSLLMSGYPGGTGARYVPATGQRTSFRLDQLEAMATTAQGVTYGGVYPGGAIVRLETTESGTRAVPAYVLGEHQDRPYAMREHDGRLLIGSIPDYGALGGALTVIDLADGDKTVLRDVVKDQSVVGVAQRGNVIYGSTTIRGGLGVEPTASEAKLFTVDATTLEKTGEFALELPSGQRPTLIGGLDIGADGLLWGSADGWVFALDPDTMAYVKGANVFPDVTRFGMWRPVFTRWDSSGFLYMNVAGRLVQVDPDGMKTRVLSAPGEEISYLALGPAPTAGQNPASAHAASGEALYIGGTASSASLRVLRITPADPGGPGPGPGTGPGTGGGDGAGSGDDGGAPGDAGGSSGAGGRGGGSDGTLPATGAEMPIAAILLAAVLLVVGARLRRRRS